jgi:hypothetical protein
MSQLNLSKLNYYINRIKYALSKKGYPMVLASFENFPNRIRGYADQEPSNTTNSLQALHIISQTIEQLKYALNEKNCNVQGLPLSDYAAAILANMLPYTHTANNYPFIPAQSGQDVSILLKFDKVFDDFSNSQKRVEIAGAQLSKKQYAIGENSVKFNNNTAVVYPSIPDDFYVTSGIDFTLEFWLYYQSGNIIMQGSTWKITCANSTLSFYDNSRIILSVPDIPANKWCKIKIEKQATHIFAVLNAELKAQTSVSSFTLGGADQPITLGSNVNGLVGNIDDFSFRRSHQCFVPAQYYPWNSILDQYGVWITGQEFTATYRVYIPVSGNYRLDFAVSFNGWIKLDGQVIFTKNQWGNDTLSQQLYIPAGYKDITIYGNQQYYYRAIGGVLTNILNDQRVWHTKYPAICPRGIVKSNFYTRYSEEILQETQTDQIVYTGIIQSDFNTKYNAGYIQLTNTILQTYSGVERSMYGIMYKDSTEVFNLISTPFSGLQSSLYNIKYINNIPSTSSDTLFSGIRFSEDSYYYTKYVNGQLANTNSSIVYQEPDFKGMLDPEIIVPTIRAGQTIALELSTASPINPLRGGCKYKKYNIIWDVSTDGNTAIFNLQSSIDAYLQVVSQDGSLIAQDDDSGGNRNSRIVLNMSMHNNISLYATTYSAGAIGTFTLIADAPYKI